MIWVDRELKKIKERNLPLEWVDDMKTPSGRIHVGALRGVVIHDLIYKVLIENKIKAKYTYVFDDHDPMDSIPSYLNYSKWEKYAGRQLYEIPSPEKGFKNYAHFYAQEFIDVFNSINCYPKIIWASQLYLQGKMNQVIKEVLDASEKIKKIYLKITKKPRPADWHPFNVRCQKCKKIGTTYVYKWDGQFVYYRCQPKMVAWATGCGYQGKVSPYNGNGKLPWKIEWAAKWKVIGVTIEGAGKDHMSAGGSHDIASTVAKEVLKYPTPYPLPYEWFTIGGKKMSSSKGVGASAFEVSQILPANVFRFFIVRTPIQTHIDFNPTDEVIFNIFDDFDRCLNAYFNKLEGKIFDGKKAEVMADFARIIELSEVKPLPKKRLYLPRFRTLYNLIKSKIDPWPFFEKQKGDKLTNEEKDILNERIIYVERLLQRQFTHQKIILNENQKKFLKILMDNLEKIKKTDEKTVQKALIDSLNKENFNPKEVFTSFYQVLLGQNFGPKAVDLILKMGVKNLIDKIKKELN